MRVWTAIVYYGRQSWAKCIYEACHLLFILIRNYGCVDSEVGHAGQYPLRDLYVELIMVICMQYIIKKLVRVHY